MPDYSNGKIYAIRAPGTDAVYIGSTTLALSTRLAHHRAQKKRSDSGKTNSVTSDTILKHPGYYIELVEKYPCSTKEELNKREGEVIRATANVVNRCIAGRTASEYKADNYDHIKQLQKEYNAKRDKSLAREFLNPQRALRAKLQKGLPLFIEDVVQNSNPELQEDHDFTEEDVEVSEE